MASAEQSPSDQSWAESFHPFSQPAVTISAESSSPSLADPLLEGLPPPEEPDPSPYSKKLELPATFVPFENTVASVRLAEFCRTRFGYDPVYTGGKVQAISGMAALRTVLGISEAEVANSLFE
jgi:hypothetical protein